MLCGWFADQHVNDDDNAQMDADEQPTPAYWSDREIYAWSQVSSKMLAESEDRLRCFWTRWAVAEQFIPPAFGQALQRMIAKEGGLDL